MRINKVCKTVAVLLFMLAFLGAFGLADEVSIKTKIEPKHNIMGAVEYDTKEVKDDAIYYATLISTWTGAGLLSILLYSLGEIIENQKVTNTYLSMLNDREYISNE